MHGSKVSDKKYYFRSLIDLLIYSCRQKFSLYSISPPKNDLPSNTIYRLYYDSKGFLWIGTDKGIVKYNGLEFERFTTSDGLADITKYSHSRKIMKGVYG